LNPGGIYYFSLSNLSRIIVDSITHQQGMFVEPLIAKNPYTNYPFSKADLFNIYFRMKFRNIKMPDFFEKYFLCEFNIYEFRFKYETELRDNAIRQYVRTTVSADLYYDVGEMLSFHKMTKIIKVDPEFSKHSLANTMRPYLELYFLERYSFSSMTRKYSSRKLKFELKRFAITNPLYGKRILPPPITNSSAEPNVWTTPFQITTPIFCEAKPRSVEQFYTRSRGMGQYCGSHYMKTHIYDESIFGAYVDQGDVFETYNAELFTIDYPQIPDLENAEEGDDWESPFFAENIIAAESTPTSNDAQESELSSNPEIDTLPNQQRIIDVRSSVNSAFRIHPESDSEDEDVVDGDSSEYDEEDEEDEEDEDTDSTEYDVNDDGSVS
jgi:hypothetical protein